MGGHGGLNILPQKRWNVYNFDNREKVRRDEEAAAREEQLKREQSRRRDAEVRLDLLRKSRGTQIQSSSSTSASADSRHINLFDGLADFASLVGEDGGEKPRKEEAADGKNAKKRKREEEKPKAVAPEDEKYKLGYGLVGKGVKAPWYLTRPADLDEKRDRDGRASSKGGEVAGKKSGEKKTIEELREERRRREEKEKERERKLLASVEKKKRSDNRGFARW
ncbi:uncharacterized protein [Typha latifolia]|uniref:uncharacterized protein n=1 Tax=Typha latifolia TaxID=4733 RepID=UPI003C2C26D5